MAKKKTKAAKKKARKPRQPQGVPDLDERLKDATPAKRYPEWKHMLQENKGEVLPPASSVESVMDPDRAKFVAAVMGNLARPAAIEFKVFQDDVAHLMALDAPTLRTVLLKHLELAALMSIKLSNDTLALIAAAETSEVAREILIGRLNKYGSFTEGVNRQRILIHKAGFMPDRPPDENRIDPADLSDEEWIAKYQPQLTAGTKPPDVQ